MPNILLIEDEKAIADTVIYALTTEGMKVSWFGGGREGLNALWANPKKILDPDHLSHRPVRRSRSRRGT